MISAYYIARTVELLGLREVNYLKQLRKFNFTFSEIILYTADVNPYPLLYQFSTQLPVLGFQNAELPAKG